MSPTTYIEDNKKQPRTPRLSSIVSIPRGSGRILEQVRLFSMAGLKEMSPRGLCVGLLSPRSYTRDMASCMRSVM